MKRVLVASILMTTIVLLASHSGFAALTSPVISRTAADIGAKTLLIEGLNLPSRPAVFMGKAGGAVKRLTINSSTRRSIEAQLDNFEPGNYIVAVAVDAETFYTSMVTIGAPSIGKMAIVAMGGGNFSDPLAALAAIGDWCGTPSATNPCLLKIMPGLYDLGSTSLQLPPYLVVEGSGEEVTKLAGAVSTSALPPRGVVVLDSNTTLKSLSVTNSGGGTHVAGISSDSKEQTVVRDVTVSAAGGEVNYGIYSVRPPFSAGECNISGVTISVEDADATANFGLYSELGILNVKDSNIRVRGQQGTSSQTSIGLYSSHTAMKVTGALISVTYGGNAFGIYNAGGGIWVKDSDIRASIGSASSHALHNNNASMTIEGSKAWGGGFGPNTYGLYNGASSSSYTIYVQDSSLFGSTGGIHNDTEYTLKISAGKITPPDNALGTYICLNSLDFLNFTPLNGSCL